MMARMAVAGLGSSDRCDDGAGPAFAALLAERIGAPDIGPIADPLDLLGRIDDLELLVLGDATRSGVPIGQVTIVHLGARELAAYGGDNSAPTSTHGMGALRTLQLAAALEQGPAHSILVGIEGADFSFGSRLSPAVRRGVETAAMIVGELVSRWHRV